MPNISDAPRVIFLVRTPRFNVESANDYGEILYIYDENHAVSPLNTDEMIRSIHNELYAIGYDPTIDYIVLTGPSLMMALFLTCAINVSKNRSTKTLMFDARHDRYVTRIVALPKFS